MQINVSCPKCNTTFDASSAVQRHVEHQLEQQLQEKVGELRASAVAEVRKDLGDQLQAKSEAVAELERKLRDARKTELDALDLQRQVREEKEQLETEIKRRVEQASAQVRKQAEQSVREEVGLQLDAKEAELQAAKERVRAAQQKELELIKQKELELLKQKGDLEKREQELRAAAIEEVRKELGDQLRAKSDAVNDLEQKLKAARLTESEALDLKKQVLEQKEQIETEIKRQVDQARALERKKAEDAIRRDVQLELDAKNAELSEAKERARAAQQKESEVLRLKQSLEEQKQELELGMLRKLDEERSRLQESAARKATEAADLKLKEQGELIQQLKKQLTATQQRLEQGSQQAQGEAQELVLDQRLRAAFPMDDFREVEKGAEGADIVQVVRDSRGRDCGSILWESKRTRNWSPGWLQKLAEDRARENASVAAIASQSLPKEIDLLGQLDGVWVCSLAHATVLAALLRQGILDVAEARQALEGQTDKMSMLYRYLTGAEFRSRAMAVVQPLARVLEQLDKERRAMTKIWTERERLVSMAFDGMTGMHKDVQRIAGVDLAMIPGTEDGISELSAIAGGSEDEAVREIETPWNQPEGKDEELQRSFLDKLKASGGYSGNLSLRRDLGWDEGSYERVKSRLVESGVVVVGPGRGGTVRILEGSAE